MKQCHKCTEFIDEDARSCPHCRALQPIRKKAAFSDSASHEAAARHHLQLSKLPPWMRGLLDLADYSRGHQGLEAAARFLGGLAGFIACFFLLDFAREKTGFFGLSGFAWQLAHIGPSLLVFYLGSQFGYTAFYVVLDSLAEILGHEKESRAKRAALNEKAERKKG